MFVTFLINSTFALDVVNFTLRHEWHSILIDIQPTNLSSYAIQQKWRQQVLHYQRSSKFVEYY